MGDSLCSTTLLYCFSCSLVRLFGTCDGGSPIRFPSALVVSLTALDGLRGLTLRGAFFMEFVVLSALGGCDNVASARLTGTDL